MEYANHLNEYAPAWSEAQVDQEVARIREAGAKVGVSIKPATPVEALRESGFDVMKSEHMELLTVRGYTDELWRRYARGPQVFIRQATQSTVRIVRKKEGRY